MKIDKIDSTKLHNDAHFQFQTEFLDLLTRTGAESIKVKMLADKYVPLYHRMDEALKKMVASAYTKRIHDADKARDETFYGLLKTIKGSLQHFDPTVKESARVVLMVFKLYGDIAKKPLNEQTSAMHNILQDLTGTYSADVNRLGVAAWVEELQNRHAAFDALMKERYDETAAKSDVVLRDVRAEIDEIYNAIVNCINAYIIGYGAEDYEVFVKTLNAIIAKYRVHKHRRPDTPHGTEVPDIDDEPDDTDAEEVV